MMGHEGSINISKAYLFKSLPVQLILQTRVSLEASSVSQTLQKNIRLQKQVRKNKKKEK